MLNGAAIAWKSTLRLAKTCDSAGALGKLYDEDVARYSPPTATQTVLVKTLLLYCTSLCVVEHGSCIKHETCIQFL